MFNFCRYVKYLFLMRLQTAGTRVLLPVIIQKFLRNVSKKWIVFRACVWSNGK